MEKTQPTATGPEDVQAEIVPAPDADSESHDDFQPPSEKFIHNLMAPFKAYFAPRYYGLEKIERDRPALYVTHHTIFGLTDGFFLGAELFEKKGIFMRALVANIHLMIPVWKDMVKDLGVVAANRSTCAELMQEKQHILVFPGGAREAFKQKNEEYKLIWKQRVGFAHMAIEQGYDIIPVTSLGGDEMYNIVWDSQDIMHSFIGQWLMASGIAERYLHSGEHIPPVARGIGWTMIPKPERIYIQIGDRIDTSRFKGEADNEENLSQLREETADAMHHMWEDLKLKRANDSPEEWWRTLLKKL